MRTEEGTGTPEALFVFHMFTKEAAPPQSRGARVRLLGGYRWTPPPEDQEVVSLDGYIVEKESANGCWLFRERIACSATDVSEAGVIGKIADISARYVLVTSDAGFFLDLMERWQSRSEMSEEQQCALAGAKVIGVDVLAKRSDGELTPPSVDLVQEAKDEATRKALFSRLGLAAAFAFVAKELQFGRKTISLDTIKTLMVCFESKAEEVAVAG